MGKRSSYTPGTFCWVELGTSDAESAKSFYSSVFGWQADDAPMPQGTYTTAKVNGSSVAGMYEAQQGPPAWLTYVSVDDAERSAKQAEQLGAQVIVPITDVQDMGRMSVLADPSGSVFAVWEPGNVAGAELVNDPGAFTMTQLNTTDVEQAQKFYGELFDWNFPQVGTDEDPYWSVNVGDAMNAGMMKNPAPNAPDHWLVYFTTPNLEETGATIEQQGGSIVMPPTSIPSGRFSVAKDPQGAYFALFEGKVDD